MATTHYWRNWSLSCWTSLGTVASAEDLAIKWSVNLHCFAKAIGGGHHKIDGFLRACEDAGALDGGAGVVVQVANENNLVLTGEMADEKFAVYNKETNKDAP